MTCRLVLNIWSSSTEEPFVQVPFRINAVFAEYSVDIQLLFKKPFDLLGYK